MPLVIENTANGYTRNTNHLRSVKDEVSNIAYGNDIDTQVDSNYAYDALGNLKHDEQEEIETIAWTVYGKIKSITRKSTSTKSNLEFTYDAAGNRTSKKEIPKTGDATTTYYVRDASGNVMATYQKKTVNSVNDLYLQEQDLFGSSRLGIQNRNLNLTTPPAATPNPFAREIGQKNFELSNHLGNVLSTVSDKRIPHNGTGGMTDYYEASVNSANDYYAFGAQMPGRGINGSNGYRYGFNGKENDREVVGTGQGTQDYGMRIYNPSLGRFLSVDPLSSKFAYFTPYQYAGNKPIQCIDLDGAEDLDYRLKDNGKSISLGFETSRWTGYHNDMSTKVVPIITLPKLNKITLDDVADFFLGPVKVMAMHSLPSYKNSPNRPSDFQNTLAQLEVTGWIAPFLMPETKAASGWVRDMDGALSTGSKLGEYVRLESKIIKESTSIVDFAIQKTEEHVGGSFKFENGFEIEFIANKTANGETLSLKDIVLYPKNAVGNELKNKFGPSQMKEVLNKLKGFAKDEGFSKLEVQFERAKNSSSAKPGKEVSTTLDVK
jgi:RHS repeat-associated protein